MVPPEAEVRTIAYDDGCVYTGETYEGIPDGRGVYRWNDGYSYEGLFLLGEFHGVGEIRSHDGCYRFTGTFYDGSIDGEGLIEIMSGIRFRGRWEKGRLRGDGLCECLGVSFGCTAELFIEQCAGPVGEANLISRECISQVTGYLDYLDYWKIDP